jgi:hypothetical protein
MRAWLLIPLVALVACMDTSKDDDDEDDDDEDDVGWDSGGEDSGGDGPGPHDGAYPGQLSHVLGLMGGSGTVIELPCEATATTIVSDGGLTGEADCGEGWMVSWDAEVDADGNIAGEATITVSEDCALYTAPLTGTIDGDALMATFEDGTDQWWRRGEIVGTRAR